MRLKRLYPLFRMIFQSGLVLGLVLFMYVFLFTISIVRGRSMNRTIDDGDRIIVDRLSLLLGAPIQRGDIVVFRCPIAPDEDYVKRVIGLPGDEVEVHAGRVRINGHLLDEPYALLGGPAGVGHWLVPEGAYFVLGDNRPRSRDSRYFDFVYRGQIEGKVRLRLWPVDHIRAF